MANKYLYVLCTGVSSEFGITLGRPFNVFTHKFEDAISPRGVRDVRCKFGKVVIELIPINTQWPEVYKNKYFPDTLGNVFVIYVKFDLVSFNTKTKQEKELFVYALIKKEVIEAQEELGIDTQSFLLLLDNLRNNDFELEKYTPLRKLQ